MLISELKILYFLNQMPRLLIFSSCWNQRRLFQDGVYLRAASISFKLATHTKLICAMTAVQWLRGRELLIGGVASGL